MEKLKIFLAVILTLIVATGGVVYAQVIRPSGDFLQPGDVESSHILNGTILNADINNVAAIALTKLDAGPTGGNIFFDSFGRFGTSTGITWATSTPKLTITGALSVSASTTLSGIEYKWPVSDGTSGQVFSTNGVGQLSWQSLSNSKSTASFTAGEALTAGDAVSLGVTSTTNVSVGSTASDEIIANGGYVAQSFTTPAAPFGGITTANFECWNYTSGPAPSMQTWIYSDNAGSPGTLISVGSGNTANCQGTPLVTDVYDSAALSLAPSTTYWFVLRQANTGTSNSIHVYRANSAGQGAKSSSDGTTWSATNGPYKLGYTYKTQVGGYAYKSSAAVNDNLANAFLGIASATVSAGASVAIDIGGVSTATTTTAASVYYLKDASGQIGTSAGTQSRKIGVGLGSAGILLRPALP